jgi:hypothetical protein
MGLLSITLDDMTSFLKGIDVEHEPPWEEARKAIATMKAKLGL